MRNGFTKQKCPKCGGNVYVDMDYYCEGGFFGWYEQLSCLQCGHVVHVLSDSAQKEKAAAAPDKAVPVTRPLLV